VRLALRELRRRPGRFVTATVILTLIAVLLMVLGSLLDGLVASSTGAIRAQQADAIVYSASAQASFQRSRVGPEIRAQVEAVDGVDAVGGLGTVQLGARVPGNGPRDLASVALFGYELAPEGVPDPPQPGAAYADETIKADGVEEGMKTPFTLPLYLFKISNVSSMLSLVCNIMGRFKSIAHFICISKASFCSVLKVIS
jgi:putative ABC transport system permease protein